MNEDFISGTGDGDILYRELVRWKIKFTDAISLLAEKLLMYLLIAIARANCRCGNVYGGYENKEV